MGPGKLTHGASQSTERDALMAATTSIYLVRHAHAEWHVDTSRGLSSAGTEAAALVGDRLASRPVVAIYTSPSRRSVQTVEPLAQRLGLRPELVSDLRERELPVVPPDEFEALVRQAWSSPDEPPRGGESNALAQMRGLVVVRRVVARHSGSEVVLGTHGNLLALIVNALDPSFGYDFWHGLSFPDIYHLAFDGLEFRCIERWWHPG